MHTFRLFGALMLASLAAASFAQPAAPNTTPRPRPANVAVTSPQIHDDGKVTFAIRAPKATEAVVAGQWKNGRATMEKNSNDVWTATVGPIEPGVYEYSFQLDGVGMIDPANSAIKPMRSPRTSILHVPGNPPLVHDFQNVPHGTVHQHDYWSKSLDRLRHVVVYTPASYDKGGKFPVLYLQHGSGDNHLTWTAHGKAHWILDNLIAQGRAKPMVVVMMDGHAAAPGRPAQGAPSNSELFERDLIEDVMPLVNAKYRLKDGPKNTALAGLSMGGEQALRVGLNHLDTFGWVGGFSSATPSREAVQAALGDSKAANKKLQLLWVACGKGDFLLQRNHDFIAALKEAGVNHQWLLTEGDHSWPVWRIYLADFAPLLFQ